MALFPFGDDMFGDMFSQMDRMMNMNMSMHMPRGFPDPFAMMPMPFGRPGISGFNSIPNMMQSTNIMMPNNGSSFVSSSFVSYSSNGAHPPQVYEETRMNQVGPGGVREERHTVRDSRTGLQKMKIGRHIKDRGHVIEKSKNHRTGDEEENNEFINIEEEEAPEFDQEWKSRMSTHMANQYGNRHGYRIQGPSHTSRLAITGPEVSISEPDSPASTSSSGKYKIKPHLKKDKKSKKPYHK